LGHNVWSGGALPVLVTVVGWLILAKGILLLFLLPQALTQLFERMQYGEHMYLYIAPSLVIGPLLDLGWLHHSDEIIFASRVSDAPPMKK
jgi:hypothetical protein